jgi:Rieske Fe-S protein
MSGRRAFFRRLGALLLGVVAAWPLLRFMVYRRPAVRRVVFSPAEAAGDPAHKDGVFLRRDNGELLALDARCTHLGCLVAWEPLRRRFVCPCHRSQYGPTGEVLQGPAARNLRRLDLAVQEDGGVRVEVPL